MMAMQKNWSHMTYGTYASYVIIAVVLCASAASAQKKSSCIECHIKLDDTRLSAPAKLFDNDIHKSRGLSCND